MKLYVADVGVDTDECFQSIYRRKTCSPHGTSNSLHSAAMTEEQFEEAFSAGKELVSTCLEEGCSTICLGELGIGNTTSAAILLAAITGLRGHDVAGRGTGINDEKLSHKQKIIDKVLDLHETVILSRDWKSIFRQLGGLELVSMAAAAVEAAKKQIPVIIDGFMSGIASAYAMLMFPEELERMKLAFFYSHQGEEHGHQLLLEWLCDEFQFFPPLLRLCLRLGEGTGAALAYPLLKAAAHIASDMASFSDAKVSTDASEKSEEDHGGD